MKWSDFVKEVEAHGVKPEDEISYIDVSFDFPVRVTKDNEGCHWRIND